MDIAIELVSDEDVQQLFKICSLAFGPNDPAWRAFYPEHWTPSGLQAGAQRYLEGKKSDPQAIYHKAVDRHTGEIIGFSIWNIYNNRSLEHPVKMPSASYWPNELEAKYGNSIMSCILERRHEMVENWDRKAVHLNTLVVLPNFQRQRVGSKLMSWGVEQADRLGFVAWVEATAEGKGLYEKFGFVFQANKTIAVPHRFADREKCVYALLVRPAKIK